MSVPVVVVSPITSLALMAGRVIVDVANPLDFSQGMPPTLSVANTDSLGEQIQRTYPETRVIKTLNTVNANVMVDPAKLVEQTHVFVSGNDIEAKATVVKILRDWFGWKQIIDLGGIETARSVEMYVLLWHSLRNAISSQRFNIKVVTS